jgi:hypothetical protein
MMNRFLVFITSALVFVACKEVPPPINYEASKQLRDTTYIASPATPQQKSVFLEDVSGVKCVNCPDAAVIAKSILDAFPGRAYTTVMHPAIPALSSFVDPITKAGHESKYDFRTKDAADILQLTGIPGSLPQGMINRRLFGSSRLIGRAEWYAKCEQELTTPTPVNIELENTFNEATGKGVIKVILKYTQAVSQKHYLTVSLIEDSIIDVQEYQDPNTFEVKFNSEYVHMHVLRDVITAATGDPITTDAAVTIVPGRVFEKSYAYTMDVSDKIKVKPKHAKLLAFVHEDSQGITVQHVNEIDVQE